MATKEDNSSLMKNYKFRIRENCLSGPPSLTSNCSWVEYFVFKLGGNFSCEPEDLLDNEGVCPLSPATQQILRERVFHDLDPRDIVDYHCHLMGNGVTGSQCYMHGNYESLWHPIQVSKAIMFSYATQTIQKKTGDMEYLSRFIRLIKHFVPAGVINPSMTGFIHGRYNMLPFDAFYDPITGEQDMNLTSMYVPNEYSIQLATEFPELFNPVGSVNPHRHDALDILEQLSQHGVNIVLWLPNSMGMDPSDEKLIPFYNKIKELNMACYGPGPWYIKGYHGDCPLTLVMLIHGGNDQALNAGFHDNSLGNPLLLRRALDCGVKIITAHCATDGYAADIDNDNRSVPCFELWLRLMKEEKYKGQLFGDMSQLTAVHRVPYLKKILEDPDLHDRLLYGSDYPAPSMSLLSQTSRLKRFGLITSEEKVCLDELFKYNPLLFDVASKRLVRGSGGEKFPVHAFKKHPLVSPAK